MLWQEDCEPKVILQRNEGECSKGWEITETSVTGI